MKQSTILIIGGAILILLILFRKPINIEMAKLSRGYRNNNPGNIRLTSEMWKGEIKGTDKSFKTFQSMAYGYRAIFVTLNSYFKKGFDTIEKIINRYAPSSENYTDAYIKTVVRKTGIPANQPLNFDDTANMKKIIAAISFVENGAEADVNQINEGYQLFKTV